MTKTERETRIKEEVRRIALTAAGVSPDGNWGTRGSWGPAGLKRRINRYFTVEMKTTMCVSEDYDEDRGQSFYTPGYRN